MHVFLATGFASNSMVDMIPEYCEAGNDNIEHFEGYIELLAAVDRLVDICNGYGVDQNTHSKRKRNAGPINTPRHSHVLELLQTLRLFEQWKVECGGYKSCNKRDRRGLEYHSETLFCSALIRLNNQSV
jgi:hypothetical protein